jgi:hypothetical protein
VCAVATKFGPMSAGISFKLQQPQTHGSGFVCCFRQSGGNLKPAAAHDRNKAPISGARSPAGQFHGYWSYTWQKTVRAERVDAALSLFGALIVRATSMSDHVRLFGVFALRDTRFKTLTQFQ